MTMRKKMMKRKRMRNSCDFLGHKSFALLPLSELSLVGILSVYHEALVFLNLFLDSRDLVLSLCNCFLTRGGLASKSRQCILCGFKLGIFCSLKLIVGCLLVRLLGLCLFQ